MLYPQDPIAYDDGMTKRIPPVLKNFNPLSFPPSEVSIARGDEISHHLTLQTRGRRVPSSATSVVNRSAVFGEWFTVMIQVMAYCILFLIASVVLGWFLSVHTHCDETAVLEYENALHVRTTHCDERAATAAVRSQRAASRQCVDIQNIIGQGHDITKWNCVISSFMVGMGQCSSYRVCASMLLWMDTIRDSMYLFIFLAILVMLNRVVTSGRVLSKMVGRAVHLSREYGKRKPDLLGAPLPPPSYTVDDSDTHTDEGLTSDE